jgi:hypothetical protein
MSSAKVARSTSSAGCCGNTNCQPPRNPNTYSAIASVCDRYRGTPMAPPASGPSEREMIAYAPPPAIGVLVEIEAIDRPVAPVMP